MLVNEIFYSIQGEGPQTGMPAWFIRFSGCNLACKWCFTPHTVIFGLPQKQIKDLKVGDEVFGFKNGNIVLDKVEEIFKREVKKEDLICIIFLVYSIHVVFFQTIHFQQLKVYANML